jgi:dynein heavy chain
MFSIDRKIYVYGGWNSENQFNNIILFDLDTQEWTDPDIYNEVPRWNHSAIMVEAIPSWKYFIFGGESGDFPEGGPRNFGNCVNSSCYLDIETMHWTTMAMEDQDSHGKPLMPPSREYQAMSYDHRESRLIVFGGWNNGWFNDLYALNVSKIVGPAYAITEVVPRLG